MSQYAIAIDIGGTKIAGGLLRTPDADTGNLEKTDSNVTLERLTQSKKWEVPTPRTGGGQVAAAVVSVVKMVAEYAREKSLHPVGIGIGSAGVIDAEGRKIASATDAIPGWSGTNLADIVEAETGFRVIIENDVHAHARGEASWGSGQGYGSTVMVAVGTGIGGAFTLADKVLRGAHGLAGHVGHIIVPGAEGNICSCGCDAHLEGIAAGPGMTRWFNSRGGNAENAVELEKLAIAGDELAKTVLTEAATATGNITAGLVNCFDPEIAILGGGLARAGELYWKPLRNAYESQLMPALKDIPLVAAELGSKAALIGAGQLAFQKFLD
ncbi:ROK family protein [Actinomycetaceae bacterium TAE3-ERU4]|nr:ROK family protein [Actinomycetaceae bacterium TAE3-ERU4]